MLEIFVPRLIVLLPSWAGKKTHGILKRLCDVSKREIKAKRVVLKQRLIRAMWAPLLHLIHLNSNP